MGLASSPSTVSPAIESVRASPWFVGRWSGDYTVEKHHVERPSVQIAWMRDDGSRFAGGGKLNFDVDAHGRLLGSGEGALGSQSIVGFLDPEALTFRLEGTPTVDAMSGVVSCGKVASGNEAGCSVNATSGDGNFVRAGSARLRQVPPALP